MDRARARPRNRAILGVGALPSTPPGSILAIRPGGLGDTLFCFPGLRALRGAFPRARLAAIGNPAFLSLAGGLLDEVAPVDAAWFGTLLSEAVPIAPEARAFLRRFDLVLSWGFDEPGFVRRMEEAGAREVRAFPFLPPPRSRKRVPAFLLDTLRSIGIAGGDPVPRVAVPAPLDAAARRELGGARPILAVHPGSGSPRKNWPAESFAGVAARFVQASRGRVLLVVGYADDAPREGFLRALDGRVGVLEARSRPLPELASLLRRSSVYLGNDSGVTHLAASVGTPTLAMFGPGSPPMFRPAGERVRVLVGRDLRRLSAAVVWERLRSSLRATGPLRRGTDSGR